MCFSKKNLCENDIHVNNIINISYTGSENFNMLRQKQKSRFILPKY